MKILMYLGLILLVACNEEHSPFFDQEQNEVAPIGGAPTFSSIHENILVKCLGCHIGAGAPMGLDMSSREKAYENLVDVDAAEGAAFGGVKRVTPSDSDPTQSYLVAKIIESDEFRVGDRMPRDGPPYLSDDEIQQIVDWIDAGAVND